jgi:hypothetical protein
MRSPFLSLFIASALAAGSLVGCGGVRQAPALGGSADDPYAAFPGPPDPPRAVRPLTARITHPRPIAPELTSFLDRLTAAVEAGNWGAAAFFLEEAGLREQMTFLASTGLPVQRAAADVLSSALGLDTAGSPLVPAGIDRSARPFAGLSRVGTMTVESIVSDVPAGLTRVEGYVRLDDRSTPRFAFSVLDTPQGPRLVVPRG